jgi:hypothetical protein
MVEGRAEQSRAECRIVPYCMASPAGPAPGCSPQRAAPPPPPGLSERAAAGLRQELSDGEESRGAQEARRPPRPPRPAYAATECSGPRRRPGRARARRGPPLTNLESQILLVHEELCQVISPPLPTVAPTHVPTVHPPPSRPPTLSPRVPSRRSPGPPAAPAPCAERYGAGAGHRCAERDGARPPLTPARGGQTATVQRRLENL